MTNTAQLCRCNNCMAIMIDENPSDQPAFEIPDNVQNMAWVADQRAPEKEIFWGCPNCLTDSHLIDIETENQIRYNREKPIHAPAPETITAVNFNTCTVRDFTGEAPITLSKSKLSISSNIRWPYAWVQIEPWDEHGSEIFCIFINNEWHQAQSIDFNF